MVDLCIIGSGSGNSLLDERFSGTSVALIDRGIFGGTCLNVGCIPTKMFVLPADYARAPQEAGRLGVDLTLNQVAFEQIRDRIFARIDPISQGGLAWREQQANVSVHQQQARFIDPHTVQLDDGQQIRAERFVLAAGSRANRPPIEGLAAAEQAGKVHTSDTIMRVPTLPRRLIILGGGYIAAEFGHVFSSYGSQVSMITRGQRLLSHADGDLSARFTQLLGEHVDLFTGQRIESIELVGEGVVVSTVDADGVRTRHQADLVLNATGRVPNADQLGLQAAGVEVDQAGFVVVDEHQRTNQPHIWALGDVCSPWMLKHVANHEMRVVQHNLLHPEALIKSDHRFVPSAVFSDPQVGQVGLTGEQAAASGRRTVSVIQEYGSVAYGWALEDTTHLVKLIADADTRQLIGAHFVGPQAATLVQQCIQAMSLGIDIDTMAREQYWIHPALPEVIENALLGLIDQIDRLDQDAA